ncbi:MAG: AAA family ATPase [candidate division Zixibacteria bacterium]|nr:AAA family ATPase [Candidatus Tariuqbacter arcticus]
MEKQKRLKLNWIKVGGFKSIREMDLEIRDINVLIGGNGSGKSNFIALFKFVNKFFSSEFQNYIGIEGGADTILHYGAKQTQNIELLLKFNNLIYSSNLKAAKPDALLIMLESLFRINKNGTTTLFNIIGPKYSSDINHQSPQKQLKKVNDYLLSIRAFHFSDTSSTSKIRKTQYIYDNIELHSDGGNLASYLYMIKESNIEYYNYIVKTVQLIAPFISELVLMPERNNENSILLRWKEKNSDYVFGPHQLPDGLLRFIALATLLLQPINYLPKTILIDEPELGLHPYALNILASMVRKASFNSQIILATHSEALLDQFQVRDIVVVNKKDGISLYNRLDEKELKEWLKDYSISELWGKNVIEGRP